jgi:hypothetical protein
MRIEHQVCGINAATRLQHLGVKQAGHFSWVYDVYNDRYGISIQMVEALELLAEANPKSIEWKQRKEKGFFSAFTVAELGEMLPTAYDTMRTTLTPSKFEWLGYDNDGNGCPDGKGYATEAECRAAMLISGKGDFKTSGYPCFAGTVIASKKNYPEEGVWPVGFHSETWNREIFKKISITIQAPERKRVIK